ncbi:MAG: winged helix-turn-helix domain-containing protein [Rhodospirillaceae bacterium]|nr:winged helix-turn-helix domain-containing protein [Rhodospirillaceae bacterium]
MVANNGLTLDLATVGHLVGDVARASMLAALLEGRALTAGELAFCANISAQTASAHLAKLVDGGLLARASQGRHRYFRLASPTVGRMLESMAVVAATETPLRHRRTSRMDEKLQYARCCYDHLAGRLGVAIADAMVAQDLILLADDGGMVSDPGRRFLERFGIATASLEAQRRCFCRPCLDWTERRPHLAGALGAALLDRMFELGWIDRIKDSRALSVSAAGARGLSDRFGIGASGRASVQPSLAATG